MSKLPMKKYAAYVEQVRRSLEDYRLFGVYWWSVKAILRQNGYDFGAEDDPATRQRIDRRHHGDETRIMTAAAKEAQRNLQAGLRNGNVYLPDGQPYYLYDPDALPHVRLD